MLILAVALLAICVSLFLQRTCKPCPTPVPSTSDIEDTIPPTTTPVATLPLFQLYMTKHRIAREKITITAMLKLFCRKMKHGTSSPLCEECSTLLRYAYNRLDRCRFGTQKSTCGQCHIHCYAPLHRKTIKQVMRKVGPLLMFHHPLLTFGHFLDSLKGNSNRPKKKVKNMDN
ncbi:hypothetical protein P9112_003363 [Eukaryota sp. TZLM1-RC]